MLEDPRKELRQCGDNGYLTEMGGWSCLMQHQKWCHFIRQKAKEKAHTGSAEVSCFSGECRLATAMRAHWKRTIRKTDGVGKNQVSQRSWILHINEESLWNVSTWYQRHLCEHVLMLILIQTVMLRSQGQDVHIACSVSGEVPTNRHSSGNQCIGHCSHTFWQHFVIVDTRNQNKPTTTQTANSGASIRNVLDKNGSEACF